MTKTTTFSVSAGLASKCLANASESKILVIKADKNLYLAKHKGRNTVVS